YLYRRRGGGRTPSDRAGPPGRLRSYEPEAPNHRVTPDPPVESGTPVLFYRDVSYNLPRERIMHPKVHDPSFDGRRAFYAIPLLHVRRVYGDAIRRESVGRTAQCRRPFRPSNASNRTRVQLLGNHVRLPTGGRPYAKSPNLHPFTGDTVR